VIRALGVALVTVALAVTAVQAQPPATKIVVYSPFTPDGALTRGVKVDRTARGSCWEGSVESRRSDAWRCVVGNNIYDPCYSGAKRWVACPVTAFGSRVLKLTLTKPLPYKLADPPLDTSRADPLLIVLQNGVQCGFASGATSTLAGQRLNYVCQNGAWLVGDPDRTLPAWSILALSSLKASSASPVMIATAWW
jgi:hypothetical protein